MVLEGGRTTSAAAKYPKGLADTLASKLVGSREGCFVIDAFAGSGIVGDAVVKLGYPVVSFEIDVNSRQEVLSSFFFFSDFCRRNAQRIIPIMLPTPCRTFSVAQSRSGRAIRLKDHPRGKPAFHTRAELERIKEGYQILHKSIALLEFLNRLWIPYTVENPFTSYLWSDQGIQECLREGRDNTRACTSVRLRQSTEKTLASSL